MEKNSSTNNKGKSRIQLDKPEKSAASPNKKSGNNNLNIQTPDKKWGRIIVVLIIVAAVSVLVVIVVQKCGKETSEQATIEDISEIPVAVDSIYSYEEYDKSLDTMQKQDPMSERPLEITVIPEEVPVPKKKLDPRFYHPDGTHKQPHEYMKYFNEDEYDDEDYEDGYEDGYDDALDEL